MHKEEKPYQCDLCYKAFVDKSALTTHKTIHTGEKPYGCDNCNKHFKTRSHLVNHQQIHTGDKPNQFEKCYKSFALMTYLKNHHTTTIRRNHFHVMFVINILVVNLNLSPIKWHIMEKKHCGHCGKSFALKNYLILHQRTHNGEKPYQCDICEKRFSEKGTLVTHRKIHKLGDVL